MNPNLTSLQVREIVEATVETYWDENQEHWRAVFPDMTARQERIARRLVVASTMLSFAVLEGWPISPADVVLDISDSTSESSS